MAIEGVPPSVLILVLRCPERWANVWSLVIRIVVGESGVLLSSSGHINAFQPDSYCVRCPRSVDGLVGLLLTASVSEIPFAQHLDLGIPPDVAVWVK